MNIDDVTPGISVSWQQQEGIGPSHQCTEFTQCWCVGSRRAARQFILKSNYIAGVQTPATPQHTAILQGIWAPRCLITLTICCLYCWWTIGCPLLCLCISSSELRNLRLMSVAYFIYLFLFSGLEYSLTFLVHQRFHYTRSEIIPWGDVWPSMHCTVTMLKWLFELPLVATVSDGGNTYGIPFLSCLAYLQKSCVYGIETQLFSYFPAILRWLVGMQQDTLL